MRMFKNHYKMIDILSRSTDKIYQQTHEIFTPRNLFYTEKITLGY